jgi:hypothetical protein
MIVWGLSLREEGGNEKGSRSCLSRRKRQTAPACADCPARYGDGVFAGSAAGGVAAVFEP